MIQHSNIIVVRSITVRKDLWYPTADVRDMNVKQYINWVDTMQTIQTYKGVVWLDSLYLSVTTI